jgi:hypothetical protein
VRQRPADHLAIDYTDGCSPQFAQRRTARLPDRPAATAGTPSGTCRSPRSRASPAAPNGARRSRTRRVPGRRTTLGRAPPLPRSRATAPSTSSTFSIASRRPFRTFTCDTISPRSRARRRHPRPR